MYEKTTREGNMVKWALIICAALFLITGTAFATDVDFSGLAAPVDITVQNNAAGLTLNGVNFGYDNYGVGTEFGGADAFGLYGTTYGALYFTFAQPANALNLDFEVARVTQGYPDSLVALFANAGNYLPAVQIPATFQPYSPGRNLGTDVGSLAYSGNTFDSATLWFWPVDAKTHYFTVENISYKVAPEPVSATLFLVGGGVLAFIRRRKK